MDQDVVTPPDRVRVAFKSIGCKLNHYEIEALQDDFQRRGYEIVPYGADADVFVVNTCTVTGSGDADSRRAVRRALRLNPDATVVATGCYAQRRPDDLRAAGAQLVLGNDQKVDLGDHLDRHLSNGSLPAPFDPLRRPRAERFLQIRNVPAQGRTRGTLKIQDGCDEHCTYCVIPSVRGVSVSRPAVDVVEQARRMVGMGYVEIALTGVHSGSYGRDIGDGSSLLTLLRQLEEVDGLRRIRLNSVEPGFVDDALIRHAASSDRLCRHFHIPLQSGDDQILRRMGRRYTTRHYERTVNRIAELIPECAIGADVMVGFPGESDEHFDNTLAFIDRLPMTYLHVFSYSPRPGTPALRLAQIPAASSPRERNRRLTALGKEKRLAFHQRHRGEVLEILVEDVSSSRRSGLATGLTDNYIKTLFEAPPDLAANQIVRVEIHNAREDEVFGEVIP